MALSAYERETIVNLNDEEPTAHVYTAQPAMMRHLARHPQAVLVTRHEDDSDRVTGEEWDLPKALISIRAGKRPVSLAQREAGRRNMARLNAAQAVATRATLPLQPRQNHGASQGRNPGTEVGAVLAGGLRYGAPS